MLDCIKSTYAQKRVLITGHTGFKGSWLTFWLQKLGANVIGYSIDASEQSLFKSLNLASDIEHVIGDIRDTDSFEKVLKQCAPDIVIHMAAQALVKPSYSDPLNTYSTNVMGTASVMDAIRRYGKVKAFINVTSDKCYENREWVWGYRENDSFGGTDPYSSSKGCAELVFSAYQRSFFPVEKYMDTHQTLMASVRAGNVIGGGDWGEFRLIPDCASSLMARKEIVLRFPDAIRPWQHVLDPLSGYLLLGARLLNAETKFVGGWNFGPTDSDAWTVTQVVLKAIAVWGEGSFSVDHSPQLHEAKMLKLDCSKAKQTLGWTSTWRAGEAIEHSIAWYKRFYSVQGDSVDMMRSITESQIELFEQEFSNEMS